MLPDLQVFGGKSLLFLSGVEIEGLLRLI